MKNIKTSSILGSWLKIIWQDATTYLTTNNINFQADREGNLWILSDRQSRFLYEAMDFDQVNFRVLTAPTSTLIQGTACEKRSIFSKWSVVFKIHFFFV